MDILKEIKTNWLIIGFFITIVLWYGDVNATKTLANENRAIIEVMQESLSQIKTDTAVIKSEVSFIKQRVK